MSVECRIPEKYVPANGPLLTRDEAEGIAQAFGISLLDWRRMDDGDAGDVISNLFNKYGGDIIMAAVHRVRRLAGRDKMFWFSAITVCSPPGIPNLMQTRPQMDDDSLWRLAFMTFAHDEQRKFAALLEKFMRDLAIAEASM